MDDNVLFIIRMYCSSVVCHFKWSISLKPDGFLLAVKVFSVHQLDQICSESESKDIVIVSFPL